MKKLNLFELAVLGLFAGVLVSSYLAFVMSSGGYFGYVLSWVSLAPLIHALIPASSGAVISFILTVIVFVIYAPIVGTIMQKGSKAKIAVLVIIALVFVAAFLEQWRGAPIEPVQEVVTAPVVTQTQSEKTEPVMEEKIPEQYFGNEATGDLDADGKDDVAFFISREDSERGMLYYLAAALATEKGHEGTNLVFLGDGVVPKGLRIEKGVIAIEYAETTVKMSTTTMEMYMEVEKGLLKRAKGI